MSKLVLSTRSKLGLLAFVAGVAARHPDEKLEIEIYPRTVRLVCGGEFRTLRREVTLCDRCGQPYNDLGNSGNAHGPGFCLDDDQRSHPWVEGALLVTDDRKYARIRNGVCTLCGATSSDEGCGGLEPHCWQNDPRNRVEGLALFGTKDTPHIAEFVGAVSTPSTAASPRKKPYVDLCRCWNEGQWGRVHREDCPVHRDSDKPDHVLLTERLWAESTHTIQNARAIMSQTGMYPAPLDGLPCCDAPIRVVRADRAQCLSCGERYFSG